jgi:hypothetical protein
MTCGTAGAAGVAVDGLLRMGRFPSFDLTVSALCALTAGDDGTGFGLSLHGFLKFLDRPGR